MKPLKTRSKLVLKNVVLRRYGEITLKILKEKPIKSIRIKAHLNLSSMYPLGTTFLINEKNKISKGLLKKVSILTFQKFITTVG
jgi:hypothetical protein